MSDNNSYISEFQQINQTDISYTDTHVESIDGSHWATINKTEIIDENKIKITFRDDNYYIGGKDSTISYKVPPFEFIKIVEKGEKFIAICIEWKSPDSRTIGVLQLAEITNETISFHHYDGHLQKTAECKYPNIISESFDFDWKFTDVSDSDIRRTP